MTKASILLVAASACIDVIEQEGRFAVAGLTGLPHKVGTRMLGYPAWAHAITWLRLF